MGACPPGRDPHRGRRVVTAGHVAAIALCALGCGARPPPASSAAGDDEIVLYRDRTLIIQRVELRLPRAGPATHLLQLPAGVGPSDPVIVDRGGLAAAELRFAGAVDDRPPVRDAAPLLDPPGDPPGDPADREAAPPGPRATPSEVALDVTAPHPGRFAVTLAYTTDRLTWSAAYTLTTTRARDRAQLAGALAIRNTTGLAIRARVRVLDDELGAWQDRAAPELHGALAGGARPEVRDREARDLGVVRLGDGETRVALAAGGEPRRLRSVLVYDPIGTGLDRGGSVPDSDPSLGVEAEAPARVSESFEIDRDPRQARSLPAGPVRLVERRGDGSLAVLGASRLFEPAIRVAEIDTVALGTAAGVTGHRERRDWAKSDDQRRFSEEFLLTIHNTRPQPVEVVLREHLYRGQNWTLAYQSAPAVKEGPQQIALRTTVPAHGRAKVLYVVVYTW